MREIPLTKLTVPLKFVKNDIPLHIETNKPITCKTLIKFINLLAKAYETQFPNGKNLNFQSTYQVKQDIFFQIFRASTKLCHLLKQKTINQNLLNIITNFNN